MKLTISISIKGVIRILTLVVLCLMLTGIVSVICKRLDYPLPLSKWFYRLFDLDGELNIPAWYATWTLLFSAGLLGIIAAAKKQECDRYFSRWKTLSLIFLFLGIDEVLSLHEFLIIPSLRKELNLHPMFYQTWVIVGAVLVGLFVVKYQKFLSHLSQKTQWRFVLAGTLFVGGALGIEMMSGVVTKLYGRSSIAFAIVLITEEFLEMLGILVFIYALLEYISDLTESVDIRLFILKKP